MKVLQSRWIAIAVPMAGIIGAVASFVWANDAFRLKAVTALGVLVLTRYAIRWIYQYGNILANREENTLYDRVEGVFVWLFQSHLRDMSETGASSTNPVHIKLDWHDLQGLTGETQRMHERIARKRNPVPVEIPEWWHRRMP